MAQAQLDLARASSGTSVIKDGNPTAFEACSISVLLKKSMVPTECEGLARPFLELEEKWRTKILLRAGIFNGDHADQNFFQFSIQLAKPMINTNPNLFAPRFKNIMTK